MRDSADAVVAVTSLSRRFGSKAALNDVWLDAPRGRVFGLVGENGAGKTTLIKHILGLLRTETGKVRVFGLDPVLEPVSVLGRIGYLSEQPELCRFGLAVRHVCFLSRSYWATSSVPSCPRTPIG